MTGYKLYIDKSLKYLNDRYHLAIGNFKCGKGSEGCDYEGFEYKDTIVLTNDKNQVKIMIDLLGLRIEKYKTVKNRFSHYAVLKLVNNN